MKNYLFTTIDQIIITLIINNSCFAVYKEIVPVSIMQTFKPPTIKFL